MVNLEINGNKVSVPSGTTIMVASEKLNIPIPRFCYHNKLSVAANCRICLVEVEKAPKPLPACAYPVMEGMKVWTKSKKVVESQQSVMEFLLINHPLDCPICDQGGECELQDIALSYGSDTSRYKEKKRVVNSDFLGPLISTNMTRCILCTRCVRFGEEIAGVKELGVIGRGESSRISTFIDVFMKSEVSGNIIDLCPVGALTSKPFEYSGRGWELREFETISPHDCVGSNLSAHTVNGRLMRIVPRENEDINEIWISDRDRFSYSGLYSEDRLEYPMIKRLGKFVKISWDEALTVASKSLVSALGKYGGSRIGALASPNSTVEEFYLLQKIFRSLGSNNLDHRLLQKDFLGQDSFPVFPVLDFSFSDLDTSDSIFLIGSYINKEQPLIGLRLIKAKSKGSCINFLNPKGCDVSVPVDNYCVVQENSNYVIHLLSILKSLSVLGGVDKSLIPSDIFDSLSHVSVDIISENISKSLVNSGKSIIIVGSMASRSSNFHSILYLSNLISKLTGSKFGLLTDGSNSAGGWFSGFLPHRGVFGSSFSGSIGLNTVEMLSNPLSLYFLLGCDFYSEKYPESFVDSLKGSECVISCTPFVNSNIYSYSNLLLPISPSYETSGTFINCLGKWQSFDSVSSSYGHSRPAWKVLRILGNFLKLKDFKYKSSSEVYNELKSSYGYSKVSVGWGSFSSSFLNGFKITDLVNTDRKENILYSSDLLVRNSKVLQDARNLKI